MPPEPAVTPPRRRSGDRRGRPFFDNTKLILLGIVALVGTLAALLALASRSTSLTPDFLAEFVLYALSATDLTILVALVFVLARNIIKLVVERRRALPFARFRAKLVAALLGMTIVPAVLILLVGSELIRNSVDRWFNAPMEDVLSSANSLAGDYYQEQQRLVSLQAQRLARALSGAELAPGDVVVRGAIAADVTQQRVDLVEVFRVSGRGSSAAVTPISEVAAASIPRSYSRATGTSLAERAARADAESTAIEELPRGGGELIRSAIPIRSSPNGPARGVVIASRHLTAQFASRARRMTSAYEGYQQLRVLKQPLA